MKLNPTMKVDPKLRSLAAWLSDRARLEEPVEAWFTVWLDLQRCLELEQTRLLAAEQLVGAVKAGMDGEILRELSVGRLRALIGRAIATEALPASVAAILAAPGEAVFFDRYVALAETVGVRPSPPS